MKNILLLLLFITLSSCLGQPDTTAEREPSMLKTSSLHLQQPTEKSAGIVYFSQDNGMTWENKSNGLPEEISIGSGGIATSSHSLGILTKEYGVYLFDFQQNAWLNIPTERQIIQSNPGALVFYNNSMYIGTQFGGVFASNNRGKTWTATNTGLGNTTIRRFATIGGVLYVGTNDGLYSYNETLGAWKLEYGQASLQVNGITEFEGSIYIGTNQGIFKAEKKVHKWVHILPHHSLHNISSDDNTMYAMTYNELLLSSHDGITWQSIQSGLPKGLYTFNVIHNNNAIFAGQWDGVYRKDSSLEDWKYSSNGLPSTFAATNITSYNGILVISCSERKTKAGITTEK